jgi:hypothetical protein
MSYVDLSLAKAHLAMVQDDDDILIQQCLDAAEAHAASLMNRPGITDAQEHPWSSPGYGSSESSNSGSVVPPSVIQGILMYAADFYENRTANITGTIVARVPTADALLHMHRVGLGA